MADQEDEKSRKSPIKLSFLESNLLSGNPNAVFIYTPRQYAVHISRDPEHVESFFVPNIHTTDPRGIDVPGKKDHQDPNEHMGMIALKNGETVTVVLPVAGQPSAVATVDISRNERSEYYISFQGNVERLTEAYVFGGRPEEQTLPLTDVHSIIVPDPQRTLSATQLVIAPTRDSSGHIAIVLNNIGKNPVHIMPAHPMSKL